MWIKATPLRTRTDLIAVLATRAPIAAMRRAIREDRTYVLGGFTPVKGFPFYAARITSYHGRVWYVTMALDEARYLMHILWSENPPEAHLWAGNPDGTPSLMNGDIPQEKGQ